VAALDFNAPTAEEAAEVPRRRAAITRRIRREVLRGLGLNRLPKIAERVLVTGAQGTGKSRTAAEQIASLEGSVVIWWLVPTLDKAEEQAAEYRAFANRKSLTAHVVRGRGAPDPRHPNEAMCPRHEVVTRAAQMGVNVQSEICDGGCSLRFSCGFQRQLTIFREDPMGLFLMAHDYLWLPCPAPRPDFVIADESVIAKATETISVDPARILDDSKWACPKDLDRAMCLRGTATLVRAAVTEHPRRELAFLRDMSVTDESLKDAADHLRMKEEAKPAVNGAMPDKLIADILDTVEAREILKVFRLFAQIRLELPEPRDRLNSVWFDPDRLVRVDGQIERLPRVFVSYVRRPYRLRKETPVLCLDGTGSLSLNRKIFGEHMTAECFAVPRDAKVYQVSNKTFSRQSITGCDRSSVPRSDRNVSEAATLRAQVVEFLDTLPGNVLLVSYKTAIEALIDGLPAHVATAHFGALRGLNAFVHCETVVVMGREQPSAQAIEALTRPFCATGPEPFLPVGDYVLQTRGRRMRDPDAPNITEAQVHFDPRCQAMLEQIREAEMVQAIDRVRPIFNHRKVFVLNNLPLDLTVDRAMTWPELRPSKFAKGYARHGVLPLSPGDLTHCFPDLWKPQAVAKEALRWWQKTGGESQIDILFGGIPLFSSGALRASYRRKGQRGPLARALVRSDLSDPRSILEGLVGELVEFQVERPAEALKKPGAPEAATHRLLPLPPVAAAMSAEAHLVATLLADERPPDVLGMARVVHLMALAVEHAKPERAAAA
jgi:hypothetical protein